MIITHRIGDLEIVNNAILHYQPITHRIGDLEN